MNCVIRCSAYQTTFCIINHIDGLFGAFDISIHLIFNMKCSHLAHCKRTDKIIDRFVCILSFHYHQIRFWLLFIIYHSQALPCSVLGSASVLKGTKQEKNNWMELGWAATRTDNANEIECLAHIFIHCIK